MARAWSRHARGYGRRRGGGGNGAEPWELYPLGRVVETRGEAQRRRFAVQLCALLTYGRFLPKAVSR